MILISFQIILKITTRHKPPQNQNFTTCRPLKKMQLITCRDTVIITIRDTVTLTDTSYKQFKSIVVLCSLHGTKYFLLYFFS